MANYSERLDFLLDTIEENCAAEECMSSLVPFMIDCVLVIEPQLPPAAAESFLIARRYAAETVGSDAVTRALIRSWESLGKGEQSMRFEDPRVSATRAIICILKVQIHEQSSDFIDIASFFLELLNNISPCSERYEGLIKKHFAKCLTE